MEVSADYSISRERAVSGTQANKSLIIMLLPSSHDEECYPEQISYQMFRSLRVNLIREMRNRSLS